MMSVQCEIHRDHVKYIVIVSKSKTLSQLSVCSISRNWVAMSVSCNMHSDHYMSQTVHVFVFQRQTLGYDVSALVVVLL